MFPPKWHFTRVCPKKNLRFYEFILVDTDYVFISHRPCKFDNTNTYYFFKMSHQTSYFSCPVGMFSPKNEKSLFPFLNPLSFNYYDYQQALYYTFFFENDHLQHSSFFIFDTKDKVKYLPFWFDQWWIPFGAKTSTMHSLLSDKFESYAKNNHFPPIFSKFPKLLYFIVHYNIPWIMGCDNELSVDTSIKYITRKISVQE
jgi:hypothetical protein